jgi:hypothetical protein
MAQFHDDADITAVSLRDVEYRDEADRAIRASNEWRKSHSYAKVYALKGKITTEEYNQSRQKARSKWDEDQRRSSATDSGELDQQERTQLSIFSSH